MLWIGTELFAEKYVNKDTHPYIILDRRRTESEYKY